MDVQPSTTKRILIQLIDYETSQVVPVNLDPAQLDSYYNGCCNGTLWPLFHSMSDKAVYSPDFWQVEQIY